MKSQAENLRKLEGISHGFFSARGGVSEGIYSSLNCGLGSSDDSAAVHENRRRVAHELGTVSARLVTAFQVHSPDAALIEAPWPEDARPRVDAIVTATPGLAVGVLTADCAPVLFCDAEAGVVGAAHAGWRGAVTGVLDDTVAKMEQLGARREAIRAAVGPCISLSIYEVGDEFRDSFLAQAPGSESFFSRPEGARKVHFDLSGYVARRLRDLALAEVEALNHCTFSEEDRYFSYRRSQRDGHSDYGRQISAILVR